MSKSSAKTGKVWRDYRIAVVALALATAFALAHFTDGEIELTDGLIYDAALAVAPRRDPDAGSRVVVIAIDQGSLGPGRFGAVPRVFLGPYFAVLLDGLFASGAGAVGFDVIFGFAASRSEHVAAGFDRPLIDALAKHRDRTVLARTARTPVADPFMAAMFDPARDDGRDESRNIAYAELSPSSDGVQRWVATRLEAEDAGDLPTFAAALAEVAGARSIPPELRLLKPAAPIESLPTYAFADVLACIEHDPKGAAQLFRDKIVVIGSTLPEEDRKRSADRFMRWPSSGSERGATSGCNLKRLGRSDPEGGTVPGVHVQAAAVAGIVTGDLATPVPFRTRLIVALATAGIGAAIALFLSPAVGVAVLGISLLVVFVACAAVLATGQWLPASVPMLAMLAATIEGQVVRFYAVDRRRNIVERAFGHYLAPSIVDSLAEENEKLQLGGELRNTTIMFADLTGFTAASETLSPAALVEIVNRYFAEIVNAIDQHRGYVDKFIGDSVMAIWGAPARITDPPDQALTCAFAINRQIARIHARERDSRVVKFSLKIGMSTGSVIVGNVGAPHRLNYSVMGEAVNVAARLEKACSDFDCAIVIDQTTATAVGEKFLLCEIDSVVLRGKSTPMSIFAPIALRAEATPAQVDYVTRYGAALKLYRSGAMQDASNEWAKLDASALTDWHVGAAAVMAARAAVESNPPGNA